MHNITIDATRPLMSEHPTFDVRNVWVLCWSQAQGCIHIETLDDMLAKHAQAFSEDHELQYIPLLLGDRVVVDHLADRIRGKVAARHNAKHRSEFIPSGEMLLGSQLHKHCVEGQQACATRP